MSDDTQAQPRFEAKVGRFDGTLSLVGFNEGDSVATIFQKAGITTGEGESINDDEGNEIQASDVAKADTTYYIVGNYKQGNSL